MDIFNFFKKPAFAEITPEELQERRNGGEKLYLLDVREPSEYAEGHIQGSKLVPLSQLSQKLKSLPTDQPIVAICRSGNRSSAAAGMLIQAGFSNVINMRGGMMAWMRSNLPIKRGGGK